MENQLAVLCQTAGCQYNIHSVFLPLLKIANFNWEGNRSSQKKKVISQPTVFLGCPGD